MAKDNNRHNPNGMLDNLDPEADINFFGIDVQNEKEFTLFIKKCEFLCRKTVEYDVWQKRTKALAVNQNSDPLRDDSVTCPICNIDYKFAAPESHHHPITLFNLCVRQFQEWVDDMVLPDKRPLDLIDEVMEKHLCNEVEHVVLCKHCHEKYHNGEQVTTEMLQTIIDYKRSMKEDSLPTGVKEIFEKKRLENKKYRDDRLQFRNSTLNDLQQDNNKDHLINDLIDSDYWK